MTRKEQLVLANAEANQTVRFHFLCIVLLIELLAEFMQAKKNAEARLKREYDERTAVEQQGRAEETRLKAQEEAARRLVQCDIC